MTGYTSIAMTTQGGSHENTAGGPDITVKVFGGLRDVAGGSRLQLAHREGMTFADLLDDLGESRPDLASRLRQGLEDGYLSALVNGRHVRFLQGNHTPLASGDTVSFLPPIGGG